MRHRIALALVMLISVSACGSAGNRRGSPAEARAMVVAYLEAVAGGESDRGWSLLLPGARRAYDSPEQYIELARGAAWDEFTWRLGEPESSYCEDGGVYCEVRLEIVGTPPGFLLEAPNSKPTDRLWTIALDQDEDATGDAWLIVYFNSEGPHGISTGGG